MTNNETVPMNNQENPEDEKQRDVSVELVAPNGLGFGEGGISVADQMEQGIITEEVPRFVHEALTEDPETFKQVEADDDGCGDGRPWQKIIQLIKEGGKKIIKFRKSSLLRAKVFGGGMVVASSMWRTINGAPEEGETVGQDRAFIAEELAKREFAHGAHSDDHASGENCGCGAIDKYPVITRNAVKYREQIMGVLKVVYGDDYEQNQLAIHRAFKVYEDLAKKEGYFADASGKRTMDQLIEAGAVVKELGGNHVEETIVINDVEGTTLDQRYLTEKVKNMCSEDKKPETVQAFSVDIWRGRKIAEVVAEIAVEKDPSRDYETVYQLAYADFLIRTLAVSGTLTAGDLPVYIRRPNQVAQSVAA